MKRINLDMDGTFVNLYGVENWLEYLEHEDTTPYEVAEPLVNLSLLARLLNKAARNGYELNIISWTSKCGSIEYNERVAEVKREWIAHHLPSVHFTHINIVDYGTPKSTCGTGILFDDEERNRSEWNGIAYDACELINVLKSI